MKEVLMGMVVLQVAMVVAVAVLQQEVAEVCMVPAAADMAMVAQRGLRLLVAVDFLAEVELEVLTNLWRSRYDCYYLYPRTAIAHCM